MLKRRSGKVSPGYYDDEDAEGSTSDSPLPGPPYPECPPDALGGGETTKVKPTGRERAPSAKVGLATLPKCQDKYERVFSKHLVRIKRQNLLPSSKRAKLNQDVLLGMAGGDTWNTERKLAWAKCKLRCRETGNNCELWRSAFKTIEGHFGSGVVSYFRFLKWLFILNIWIAFLVWVFVIIPQLAFRPHGYENWVLSNTSVLDVNQSETCTELYVANVTTNDVISLILDFLQGTGWLEKTLLFYGHFTDKRLAIISVGHVTYFYSLPLAYLLVAFCVFGLSLVLMAKNSAGAFRSRVTETSNTYSNVVFGGWDYALSDEKARELKHRSLYNQILADLDEDRDARRRACRDSRDRCRLFTIRLCINLFVIAVLGACGYGIYYITDQSLKFKERPDYATQNNFVQLLMEYLPSLSITVLNVIVPLLFTKVVAGEDYSPVTQIQITLGRTVFLRLASLAVLLGTVYSQVTCGPRDETCDVGLQPECLPLRCWETYMGQQIYKLVILDFFVVLAKVFLLDFPRRLIVTKCDCQLARLIGQPEFVIPQEVLALIYSQILCWIGAFFSPLIPTMCMTSLFVVFYLKKLTCISNHVPPARPYHDARSRGFYMGVLIAAFVLCCVPIGYIVWKIPPSHGCGPFRIYPTIYSIVTHTIASWPPVVQQIMSFVGSAAVIAPAIVILVLFVYYCSTLARARSDMVGSMQEQLILERKDKKFLLRRVSHKGSAPGREAHHRPGSEASVTWAPSPSEYYQY